MIPPLPLRSHWRTHGTNRAADVGWTLLAPRPGPAPQIRRTITHRFASLSPQRDVIPAGMFPGGDEVPAGTLHGA